MVPDAATGALRPHESFLSERLEGLRRDHPSLPEFKLIQYDPLLDSSDMTSREWIQIARDIERYYYEYTGFVVLHGTDTMAFTASALSYMLESLAKPVVLTGSMLSLVDPLSDGHANLAASLMVASGEDIPEVCIFFNGKLMRGNRAAASSDCMGSPAGPSRRGTRATAARSTGRPACCRSSPC